MIIYRASVETVHFTFEAFSTEGRQEALRELENGLKRHCDQVGIDFSEFMAYHDHEEHEFISGAVYRDAERI